MVHANSDFPFRFCYNGYTKEQRNKKENSNTIAVKGDYNKLSANIISRLKHKYLALSVNKTKLPFFPNTKTICKTLIFSGKVQSVGFRFQTFLLAEKLKLAGYAKNLENGNVEVLAQGTEEKIEFLIDFMKSRKRLRVDNVVVENSPVCSDLNSFSVK